MDRFNLSSGAQPEPKKQVPAPRPRRPVGEILMEMGKLTVDQLTKALEQQKIDTEKRLGEIIVKMGMVDEAQLAQALDHQDVLPHEEVPRGRLTIPIPEEEGPPKPPRRWKSKNQQRDWNRRLPPRG